MYRQSKPFTPPLCPQPASHEAERWSAVIAALRLPLAAGIVLIHSRVTEVVLNGVNIFSPARFPLYDTVSLIVSGGLAHLCVPFFFFISGLLFFKDARTFTASSYARKLKSRARSLLVPYVFWNLTFALLLAATQAWLPALTSGSAKPMASYTWADWLSCFWSMENMEPPGHGPWPVNGALWFVRDLMVTCLLSPAVWWLASRLRGWGVAALGAGWLCCPWLQVPGLSLTAVFFFTAGAAVSICGTPFLALSRRWLPGSLSAYAVLLVLYVLLQERDAASYIQAASVVVGLPALVGLADHCVGNSSLPKSSYQAAAGCSFFVYAYHLLVLTLIRKSAYKLLHPESDLLVLALYFLCPALTILLGCGLYHALRRYAPQALPLLTGGR